MKRKKATRRKLATWRKLDTWRNLAATYVFWDINTCPVPPGFDARRVGPCIKRFLEDKGYYGSLTITAAGKLTDIPDDTLRALSSTGITLHHVPYGSSYIADLLFECADRNTPPANMMVISKLVIFDIMLPHLTSMKYNILGTFPYVPPLEAASTSASPSTKAECLWESFLLADSGALEEDKCSETACWFCAVCDDIAGQGFENFTTHLSSQEHTQNVLLDVHGIPVGPLHMAAAPSEPHEKYKEPVEAGVDSHPKNASTMVKKQAKLATWQNLAVTYVFWDIKRCPVPPGFDARRVGPCIKRFLEDKGYCGSLTITAAGKLTDIPDDTLRALSSTGIGLRHTPHDSSDIVDLLFEWADRNTPPANMMVISVPGTFNIILGYLNSLEYNIIEPFPYVRPLEAASTSASPSTKAECLWESFLLADSGALEEDKGSETGETACWVCSVCDPHIAGQGFENFTTHLSSRKHTQMMLLEVPFMHIGP